MPLYLNGKRFRPPGVGRAYVNGTLVYQAGSGGGGSGPYQPNANGNLAWEAEGYDANTPGPTHAWDLVDEATLGVSLSGGLAMQGLPDSGAQFDAGDPDAPVLGYEVNVPSTGAWYLYLRGRAPDGAGNSVFVRAGGGSWSQAGIPTNGWGSAIAVSLTAGVRTIELQIREDGAAVDRFVLTSVLGPAGLDAEPNSERA